MACHVCDSVMHPLVTDLPSERDKHGIVIGRDLPVLHCANCGEHLFGDGAMARGSSSSWITSTPWSNSKLCATPPEAVGG